MNDRENYLIKFAPAPAIKLYYYMKNCKVWNKKIDDLCAEVNMSRPSVNLGVEWLCENKYITKEGEHEKSIKTYEFKG